MDMFTLKQYIKQLCRNILIHFSFKTHKKSNEIYVRLRHITLLCRHVSDPFRLRLLSVCHILATV